MSYSLGDKVVLKNVAESMFYYILWLRDTKVQVTLAEGPYMINRAHIKGLYMLVKGVYKIGSLTHICVSSGNPTQDYLIDEDNLEPFQINSQVTEFLGAINVLLNTHKVAEEPSISMPVDNYTSYNPQFAFDINLEAVNA